MGRIEVDFQNAQRQVKKLRDAANDIEKTITGTYANAVSDTAAAWKGENASNFVNKADEIGTKIKTTAKNIRDLADAIERAALKVYRAEKKAEEIARSRGFGGGGGGGGGFR